MIKDFYTIVGMLFLTALVCGLIAGIGYLITCWYEKRKQRKEKEKEDDEFQKRLKKQSDIGLEASARFARKYPDWYAPKHRQMIEEELHRRKAQKQS